MSGGHGRFRVKGVKLVTPKGEAIAPDDLVLCRVLSVDVVRKLVVVDPEGLKAAVEKWISERDSAPLQTPAGDTPAAASSAEATEARGPPVAPPPGAAGR